MKLMKKGIACLLALSVATVSSGTGGVVNADAINVQAGGYEVNDTIWKYGIGSSTGFNENTYKTVERATSNDNWRDGSVTANGEIGFIESCDPKEDVFIFNNTKIVTDGGDIYETPVINGVLDEQRLGAIERNNFPWIREVERYAQEKYGTGWGTTWPRKYQPAAQYRIVNNDYTSENSDVYNRYTNYETGEVGVQWKDADGNEWNRRSFASRSDDVIVTYIEAPEGKDLDITIELDNMVEMRNQGTTYYRPTSDNVVTSDDQGYAFGMVAKYAIQNRKGSKNPEETKFSRGGWSSATRIVKDGNVDYRADTRDVKVPSSFGGGTIKNANDPKFNVTGTKSVMLITKVDRIDSGCNDINDVKNNLYDRLVSDIDSVVSKYQTKSNEESYQAILKPHVDIHGGMFKNVKIDICSTDEEKADRSLTNTELIAKQNDDKDVINKAFLERIYNNGRFGLICASGYGSTRLGAIWNGAWNPDWSGDFTLDANTNLQVSGMNTGNMSGASDGYVNFIIRMVADWDDDAANIYGMTDAIKAPPRVDGTGEAGSFHFLEGYPHIYVNGITDWLIIPMFEYWQCYGNRQIKVGKDVDVDRDREVLDLTDADVERIKSTGYMDLEKDILYPMLKKTMNFWLQYVDDRYYTDGAGVEHADDGTTINDAIAAGDTNCKYIYTPGYSPENTPKGEGDNSKYALAYNTTMDIAASRDTLFMARAIIDKVNPADKAGQLAKWADFETKIPEYLYDDNTGALKEWATPRLEDNHYHRHVSHAYVAWPGYESQTNEDIRVGVVKAMDERSKAYGGKEAGESHGPTHKALVEARIKNAEGFEKVLNYLLTSNYQYSSMMTSHNDNHNSTYCTDSAFGIMGAMNEALLYSNTGVVEILPTLMESADKGSITGLRARCNTQCDIVWDINNQTASVTLNSDEDNNVVKVRCGQAWSDAYIAGVKQNISTDEDGFPYVEVTLTKNVPVKFDFILTNSDQRVTAKADADLTKSVASGSTVNFTATSTFDRTILDNVTWAVVDAANDAPIAGVGISNGTFVVPDSLKGKTIKVYATAANSVKSNELMLHIAAATETFGMVTGKADDNVVCGITNDGSPKNLSVILAAEDANGMFVTLSEKDITLGANEFGKVMVPLKWIKGSLNAKLYVWDKTTNAPYTEPVVVK